MTIDAAHIPSAGLEARGLIVRNRQGCRTIDGNAIVIEQDDQLGQFQMTGKRDCFVADPFHQASIARDGIGVMIYQV